jgi:hypothetical protein
LHAKDPVDEEKLPPGQREHVVEPASEKLPDGHDEHPDAIIVPGSVTEPAYPGAQIVHAETESLPVDELLV